MIFSGPIARSSAGHSLAAIDRFSPQIPEMVYNEYAGWLSNSPEKNVCSTCVTDAALAGQVQEESSGAVCCSYCKRPGAAPLQVLADAVLEGLGSEWTDPANELFYIGREGGYQGDVTEGDELVRWEIEPFSDDEDIIGDVADSLAHLSFTKRDYGLMFRDEALSFAWKEFVRQVKHRTRYLFLTVDDDDDHPDHIPPGRMLVELGDEVQRVDCTRTLAAGSTLYRVRVDAAGAVHATAQALGSPPPAAARWPNRMSPAGIPMFYAALDRTTALAETLDPEKDASRVATVGTWMPTRELRLLDLMDIGAVPSLFDAERRHLRRAMLFLKQFSAEVSRPISTEEEHLEYVPTQIVTEYFRVVYRTAEEAMLDGILYRSSRTGEPACVLFAEPDDCGEWDGSGNVPGAPLLLLLSEHTERLDGPDALGVVKGFI